jgi:hypothetical protein
MFTSQRGGWTNSSTKLASFKAGVKMHEVFSFKEFENVFRDNGMEITVPPIGGKSWKVENEQIVSG